jgi:hypothetical protein
LSMTTGPSSGASASASNWARFGLIPITFPSVALDGWRRL